MKNFDPLALAHTTGQVTSVRYPIVQINGLSNVYPRELVHFEDGGFAQVLSTEKDVVTTIAFNKKIPRVGSEVKSSNRVLSVRLCPEVLGTTIDALGNQVGPAPTCSCEKEEREIDIAPPPLTRRTPITHTLKTGVALADLLLPLAKGQRELILGDRKTGKSTFLLQTAMTQVSLGTKIVYACIGKKSNQVKELIQTLEKSGIRDNCCLVISTADESPSTISKTPFTAMTVAEYLRDQGHDVLVILDDLTTHAMFYREISLLAKQFPGRDSYPGDMFYTHARLLERSGNFYLDNGKTASITCLPVVETHDGELTHFIVSNLISITDGHLFFHTDLFSRGLRPAIHAGLSVTRVGKQTQTPLERDMSYALSLFLTQYEKTRGLAHFGAELNDYTKLTLTRGDALFAFFNQSKDVLLAPAVMLVFAACIYLDWFNDIAEQDLLVMRDTLTKKFRSDPKAKEILTTLANLPSLTHMTTALTKQKKLIIQLCQA